MYRYILLGWMAISSLAFYLLDHSKDRVIGEVIASAHAKNADALSGRIAWDGLRAQLKESIAEQKKQLGQYSTNIGPNNEQIAPVVDYYVRPENLAILFHYHDVLFPDVPEGDFIDSAGYYPPFGFHVTFGYPKNRPVSDPAMALLKDRVKVRAVFKLDGFTWKISELQVPIMLVPRQTYPEPAVKLFGPP